MRFKIAGVVLLVVGFYFALHGLLLAGQAQLLAETAKVEVLIAIFLATTVRVLQAEKHHREQARREHEERERLLRPEPGIGPELVRGRELEGEATAALDRR